MICHFNKSLLVKAIILNILNIVDLVVTLYWINQGLVEEANPFTANNGSAFDRGLT